MAAGQQAFVPTAQQLRGYGLTGNDLYGLAAKAQGSGLTDEWRRLRGIAADARGQYTGPSLDEATRQQVSQYLSNIDAYVARRADERQKQLEYKYAQTAYADAARRLLPSVSNQGDLERLRSQVANMSNVSGRLQTAYDSLNAFRNPEYESTPLDIITKTNNRVTQAENALAAQAERRAQEAAARAAEKEERIRKQREQIQARRASNEDMQRAIRLGQLGVSPDKVKASGMSLKDALAKIMEATGSIERADPGRARAEQAIAANAALGLSAGSGAYDKLAYYDNIKADIDRRIAEDKAYAARKQAKVDANVAASEEAQRQRAYSEAMNAARKADQEKAYQDQLDYLRNGAPSSVPTVQDDITSMDVISGAYDEVDPFSMSQYAYGAPGNYEGFGTAAGGYSAPELTQAASQPTYSAQDIMQANVVGTDTSNVLADLLAQQQAGGETQQLIQQLPESRRAYYQQLLDSGAVTEDALRLMIQQELRG